MPSALTELMLRSPDSNNLANASLWEGHRTGGDNRGIPCSRAETPAQGVGRLLCGSVTQGPPGSGRKSRAERVPRTQLHLETGP